MPKIRVADVICSLTIQCLFRPIAAWCWSVVFEATFSSPNASVPWITSMPPGRASDVLRDWAGGGSVAFARVCRWATRGIANPIWRAVANFFIWPMRHLFPGDVLTLDQPADCGGESDARDGWEDVDEVHKSLTSVAIP
jgi:hypothetical protein